MSAGVLAVAAACSPADDREEGTSFRAAHGLDRLAMTALAADSIGVVRDFDLIGDSLYLLDIFSRVHIAVPGGEGWVVVGGFGQPGHGPGELARPFRLELLGNGIAVVEASRLQVFSRTGELLAHHPITRTPCPMSMMGVAGVSEGILMHGRCQRPGYTTDTVKAVLAWSRDTVQWDVIAEDLIFTRDGRLGSMISVPTPLIRAPSGGHYFGAGTTNCLWHVEASGAPPRVEQQCPVAGPAYRSRPPAGYQRRLRLLRSRVGNLRWPDPLPPFLDRIDTSEGMVLLRLVSPDSIVLQTAAPESRDVAMAPLDGLVGCKATGCLWIDDASETTRLIVLRRAALEERVRKARSE